MLRPPSEDGFLFISSRFELLQSGAIALRFPYGPHTPPGFPSSYDSVLPGEGVGSTD